MQLHEIKRNSPRKTAKRIARGGKRGKTSGRGGKGQTARAGNSMRPEMRAFIKKLPKLRGHGKNRARTVNSGVVKPVPVNLNVIEKAFSAGEVVSPQTLVMKAVIATKSKRAPVVKILATGEVTKKLKFEGCLVSEAARVKIEKAGGEVTN